MNKNMYTQMSRQIVILLGLCICLILPLQHTKAQATQATPMYLDASKPTDARVRDLISRLTLEEKGILLNHKGPTIERLNIRSDQWNQCLNGVKWDNVTTLFPTCIAMGGTWNTDLVKEVANALSDEARAIYNGWHNDPNFKGEKKGLIYRAPVINICRNPYWGRTHEAYSEDTYLTGRMAVAYVQGLQGDNPKYLKIAATLKHYAVNNVETDRQKLNASVPERWLHEYWLPHFKDAVVEGKAQSLMASYNAINGTPNNINHYLLTDVLKDDWKHEGFVVSDLGGVKSMVEGHEAKKMSYVDAVALSIMAGCDFSDAEFQQYIPEAVRSGKLTEERLNDALFRVLRTRMRLGEFDSQEKQPWSKIPLSVIDGPEHRALALKTSQQSIVLLKNKGGMLPLDGTKLHRVAVIGPNADRILTNNYNGKFQNAITPLQGLKDKLPAGCEVTYTAGGYVTYSTRGVAIDTVKEMQTAVELAKKADVAILYIGTDRLIENEGRDRKKLGLPGNQEELVKAVFAANPRTIVVLMNAGPLTVNWLNDNVPAMMEAWWPGEEGGHAIADALLGNINPAGRLPYTVYASEAQVPSIDVYDISKGFTYMFVKGRPLFPFGYGLSYTTFNYSNLKVPVKTVGAKGKVTVTVDIANTGKRAGDEVVQLYTHQEKSSVVTPVKALRSFKRIALKPGEKKTVTLTFLAEKLAYWDEKSHAFVVEPGKYDLLVGSSSEDIKQTGSFVVKAN